jgi:hypothetical protein
MLGSQSKYFAQSKEALFISRDRVFRLLDYKGYSLYEIIIYLRAFDYFCKNPNAFDGATIVKDLQDLPHLDLDAMLHDYHYLVCNAGANFKTKFQADWMYAKGNERKGKGQYSAFSRFVGLTIVGIGFVPYAYFNRGKISETQRKQITVDYKILIK